MAHLLGMENLRLTVGSRLLLDEVTLGLEDGTRVGVLGPNGAGKSTAMRCLTGLAFPTEGEALINGRRYRDIPNPSAQVGVLLDASAQHPGRTGRETLRAAATVMGAPRSRVDEVIELAGLTAKEARKRVATYSLGMRQRLGIAQAFLGSPRVLILDEPANGLDPQGIHWMRTVLRRFADAGGAVLLSSHLLHEVQQVADRIVMIGHGRILTEGSIDDLTADGTDLETTFLNLTTTTARGGIFV